MFTTYDVHHSGTSNGQLVPRQIARNKLLFANDQTPDAELIQRVGAGDTAALRILYARHSAKVYRFALRRVGEAMAAEDILSDVFFDLWRQAEAFDGVTQLSTWLLHVARNKAVTISRRERRLPIANETENPSTAPQDIVLSSEHREIVDLVYYHRKTIGEIAGIVHLPPGSVKQQMLRARQRLTAARDARRVTIDPARPTN